MKLYVQSEDSPTDNKANASANPAVNKTMSEIFIQLIEHKINQMNQSTKARPSTEMDQNEMKHSNKSWSSTYMDEQNQILFHFFYVLNVNNNYQFLILSL